MLGGQTMEQTGASQLAAPKRLLLVEDNPAHARLFVAQFQEVCPGVTIDWVGDGERALAFLLAEGEYRNRLSPDLILLDLKMPRMNGHELLSRIKGHRELRAIPVVILTTSTNESDIRRAYQAGANGYLVKPFGMEDLAHTIHSLTDYWLMGNQSPGSPGLALPRDRVALNLRQSGAVRAMVEDAAKPDGLKTE